MRSFAYVCPVLLFACTDRPLASTNGAGDSTDGATTPATPSSSSADPTPAGGTSEAPPTTGSGGSDPGGTDPGTATTTGATTGLESTGPSSAVTTDDSTTQGMTPDTTGTTGQKLDLPDLPQAKPPGVVGCPAKFPPGTAVGGKTRLGPFKADRAYFGAIGTGDDIYNPRIVVFSPGADPATELQQGQGTTGAFASIWPQTEAYDAWIGQWDAWGDVVSDGMIANPVVKATITGFAGNWDAADPADPPRLVGSFAGDLVGDFDAVYCDKADIVVIPE